MTVYLVYYCYEYHEGDILKNVFQSRKSAEKWIDDKYGKRLVKDSDTIWRLLGTGDFTTIETWEVKP
jgi:hypothetical protein